MNAIMDFDRGMTGKSSKAPKSAALEEARLRQHAIGVKLRQMFDEVVSEPVPDEFLDILRRAEPPSPGRGSDADRS